MRMSDSARAEGASQLWNGRGPPIGLLFCVRLHHRGRDWRDHDRWLRGRRRHRRGTCGKLVVAEGSCAIGEAPEVLLEPSPRNLRRFIDSQPPHPMDMTDIWAIWGGAASQVRQITNKGGGHLQPGRLVFGSAQGEERRARNAGRAFPTNVVSQHHVVPP